MIRRVAQVITNFVGRTIRSPKFFYVTVILLVVQAVWIALTARYPQAFDENYHFGLIQLHAQQLLPYFTQQPPGDAIYGAIARDPSYLYHYLLSFPYRLLVHLTDSLAIQVITLRFINIAIFVGGLFVFRKLLTELGISRAINNVVLLFFVMTPVVVLLAAQINYDNLMFLAVGMLFLLTVRYYKALQASSRQLPLLLGLQLFAVGAFGSLVKFPFAPIFLATIIILAFLTWRKIRQHSFDKPRFVGKAAHWKLASYGFLAVLAAVLCIERYGVNVIAYHSPVPKCHKILSIDECQAYAPWARDYLFAATYPRPTAKGIIVYPAVWAHRMVYETMFTLTSTYWEDRTPNRTVVYYYVGDPLPIANLTAWAVVAVGAVSAAWHWRRLWRNSALLILLAIIAFYTLILFAENSAMYLHTGEAVAIHGRYLVPVYPVLYLVLALAIGWMLERFRLERFKTALLIVLVVLFLQGGGVITWIVRGNDWWYWPQSYPAQRANWLAQDVLDKIILR